MRNAKEGKQRKRRPLAARKARTGRLFVLPFAIGFVLFFVQPMVLSLYYSFTNNTMSDTGYVFTWTGLANLRELFLEDTNFLPTLFDNVESMAIEVPVITLFSLFIATILNQKFKGRTFARSVFFLPVLISSGIIINILYEDVFNVSMRLGAGGAATMFQSSGLQDLLVSAKVPSTVINLLVSAISGIFDMLWATGVQVLIFLAAMQNVSSSLYEAAKVEGANSWEIFWKITLPMISPMILVNVIYTIIDSLTNARNPVMSLIYREGITKLRYSYACAMGWVFLIMVIIFVAIVYLLISLFVNRITGREGGKRRV